MDNGLYIYYVLTSRGGGGSFCENMTNNDFFLVTVNRKIWQYESAKSQYVYTYKVLREIFREIKTTTYKFHYKILIIRCYWRVTEKERKLSWKKKENLAWFFVGVREGGFIEVWHYRGTFGISNIFVNSGLGLKLTSV